MRERAKAHERGRRVSWLFLVVVGLALVGLTAGVAHASAARYPGVLSEARPLAVAVLGAAATVHGASLTSAGNASCPTSGPLGGLNDIEAGAVLAVTVLASLGVGIGLGRWSRGVGPVGGGAGKTPEPLRPALNPQPLPPGIYAPGSGSGAGAGGGTATPDLSPQPLPPGLKRPPGGTSGGDRPT